jgi:hypothetical protein
MSRRCCCQAPCFVPPTCAGRKGAGPLRPFATLGVDCAFMQFYQDAASFRACFCSFALWFSHNLHAACLTGARRPLQEALNMA